MALIDIQFNEDINISTQIGDYAFYLPNSFNNDKGYDWTSNSPILFGSINNISGNTLTVDNEDTDLQSLLLLDPTSPITPNTGDFIMFAKDSSANMSGVKGYYMEVTIKNNSTSPAELFTLGSETNVSSK
tara:strand:+ start:4214 stop:4603 length:390 start_codon:yes stop_codon:yes gene_type:complete